MSLEIAVYPMVDNDDDNNDEDYDVMDDCIEINIGDGVNIDTTDKVECDICANLVNEKEIVKNNCNCINKQWCCDCLIEWIKQRPNRFNKCEMCQTEFTKVIVERKHFFEFISRKAYIYAAVHTFIVLIGIGILSYYSDGKILMVAPIWCYYMFMMAMIIMGCVDKKNYLNHLMVMHSRRRLLTKRIKIINDDGEIIKNHIVK